MGSFLFLEMRLLDANDAAVTLSRLSQNSFFSASISSSWPLAPFVDYKHVIITDCFFLIYINP